MSERVVQPWTRVAILVLATGACVIVARVVTGSFIPENPRDALIFQNALLLVVLGSAVVEHKFTKPGDSVVNGLMAAVTLLTVYGEARSLAWWAMFTFCAAVFLVAAICSIVSTGAQVTGWKRRVAAATYRPAIVFGRARLLFSAVFLYGVFTFYGVQSTNTAILVVFWGIFVSLWPLQVPQLLSALAKTETGPDPLGHVVRTDWPDLIRVELAQPELWDLNGLALFIQADGAHRPVVPLYRQVQAGAVLGTGMCGPPLEKPQGDWTAGSVYPMPTSEQATRDTVLAELRGEGGDGVITGFVVEDSVVGAIRFETWSGAGCQEGQLVWCRVGKEIVYYQVTAGATREETLSGDRHGFQVASAAQLGVLDSERGFRKKPWLPVMNTPVFSVSKNFGSEVAITQEGDFKYGVIPGTDLSVGGPFAANMEYHTAVLGVTGSGKTELTFDLIRAAVAAGIRVICVDITARYAGRLEDLGAKDLSIASETSAALSQQLFAVETGSYGAGKEKTALKKFSDRLRSDVDDSLSDFLTAADGPPVGIITLEEISNTKATIYITELFLTGLLNFVKNNRDTCPRVLVVVEEAHTVIPEASTMGLADFDSRGLVGKIAQVALQGRKYGVGLLVVAQRTATVSKTVLTQCNTMITLNTFDETSLGFLRNMYGKTHTDLISDLLPLQAVIYGKGVRSERPVMVQIPFDEKKKELGD